MSASRTLTGPRGEGRCRSALRKLLLLLLRRMQKLYGMMILPVTNHPRARVPVRGDRGLADDAPPTCPKQWFCLVTTHHGDKGLAKSGCMSLLPAGCCQLDITHWRPAGMSSQGNHQLPALLLAVLLLLAAVGSSTAAFTETFTESSNAQALTAPDTTPFLWAVKGDVTSPGRGPVDPKATPRMISSSDNKMMLGSTFGGDKAKVAETVLLNWDGTNTTLQFFVHVRDTGASTSFCPSTAPRVLVSWSPGLLTERAGSHCGTALGAGSTPINGLGCVCPCHSLLQHLSLLSSGSTRTLGLSCLRAHARSHTLTTSPSQHSPLQLKTWGWGSLLVSCQLTRRSARRAAACVGCCWGSRP